MNSVREQRDHHRMSMNTPVSITSSDRKFGAICIDLSATGVLLHTAIPLARGSIISFELEDNTNPLPAMKIRGEVIRCKALSIKQYELAIFAL